MTLSRRAKWWAGILVVGAAGLVALWRVQTREQAPQGLIEKLAGRKRVLVWRADEVLREDIVGTTFVRPAAAARLSDALRRRDEVAAAKAMRSARVQGILVNVRALRQPGAKSPRVIDRMGRYEYVPPFRGVYLTSRYAFYAVRDNERGSRFEGMLGRMARQILSGEKPPPLAKLPESLRRLRTVEVLVLLREGSAARLWRSARGSSLARALITATMVARQRWAEREKAMGGPLLDALPRLDVEISLLEEDGTLGARSPGFLERVISSQHGVAYEGGGAWRYLLPVATQEAGKGSGARAYQALFRDNALREDSFDRADLRLYRLVLVPLDRSPAETRKEQSPAQ